MKIRFLLAITLSSIFFYASTAVSAEWQLPPGHYTPAKMPMVLVHPRPDSETSSAARHRIAYADGIMQYRIPVVVQGGAYPFHFELISAPQGMTIGKDYGEPDHGVITWTPTSQGGPFTVEVKVTDQEGNTVTAAWTVTADNSKFIFIDPTSPTNGDGTKVNPFNTMAGISTAENTGLSPYAGKAVILRAGTTAFYGPEPSGNYRMTSDTKNPNVFLGYTGEIAVLDMSAGAFQNYGMSDTYFGQLTLKNAKPDGIDLSGETDTLMYFDWGATNRTTFFENRFENLYWYSGAGSSSNQAAIVFWNPGSMRQYFAAISNIMSGYSVSLTDLFNIRYIVQDKNVFEDSGADFVENGGFNVKSDLQYVSIRENTANVSFSFAVGLLRFLNQVQSYPNDNIEIAYNRGLFSATDNAMFLYQSTNGSPNVWVYRNTLLGNIKQFDVPGTVLYENNVIVNDTNYDGTMCGASESTLSECTILNVNSNTFSVDNPTGNIFSRTSDQVINKKGDLRGEASAYLGRVGYQITGKVTLPKPPTSTNVK